VISLFIVGGILGIAFVLAESYEKLVPMPIVPMKLFKNWNVTVCAIINFFTGFGMIAIIYYLPIYFEVR
jgi:hypothetical protein